MNDSTHSDMHDLSNAPQASVATSGQFSLRAMLLTTGGFGVLFGVCSALRLPPLHVLAAFVISAVTALVTVAIVQFFGRHGTRHAPSQHWGRCSDCLQKCYVYPNNRCHECCLNARDLANGA